MALQEREPKARIGRKLTGSFFPFTKRGVGDSVKEDARKAVHDAINKAYRAALENDGSGSGIGDPIELSHNVDSPSLSHEKAIDRGVRLGSVELNESEKFRFHNTRRRLFSDDLEQNQDTRTRTTTLSGHNSSRSMNWLSQRKKMKAKVKEADDEAWMCGVCSRGFSSYEAAEKHENYHIKEILVDLGWIGDSNGNDASSGFFGNEPPQNEHDATERMMHSPKDNDNRRVQQHGPDALLFSSPLRASKKASVQPFTPALKRTMRVSARQYSNGGFPPGHDDTSQDDEFQFTTAVNVPRIMTPIHENHDHKFLTSIGGSGIVPLVLADEALVDVCRKAESLGLLTDAEKDAEFEIKCLAKDKAYYDNLFERTQKRKRDGTYRFRREGTNVMSVVQNKFVDAYQLMKEGKTKRGNNTLDYYTRKLKGGDPEEHFIDHTRNTVYVNVMVKNSIKVVRHELERLAKKRWEDSQLNTGEEVDIQRKRFQKFRAAAQGNLVKLAGYALASDFTPRRIAVQLSNDLYRLLTPKLKNRGVTIETEIEYRVGPYFVLAVNILNVHWRRLVKVTHQDVAERRSRWRKEQEGEAKKSRTAGIVETCVRLTRLTRIEVLAQLLAWMYYLHWAIFTPICFILYQLFPKTFRTYFLSSVADEIFFYVEQKGMQMDIGIQGASTQAAFMLSALREIRADGREQKKKKKQEGDAGSQGVILGPLLGLAIKSDCSAAPPKPPGFEIPSNLDFVGLELDVPVGFKRLRWALLSSSSSFIPDAVFQTEAKYENIQAGTWSIHDDAIGNPTPPEGASESDFIGAEKEFSYLMPKSAFVKANMCYETAYIEAYNDHCFCFKKKALTPEVPYGSSFVAWTKFIVINNGSNSSKLICSVEAEFPNGPPMISRQIQSGMKAGVGELFVKIGETITRYADQFP